LQSLQTKFESEKNELLQKLEDKDEEIELLTMGKLRASIISDKMLDKEVTEERADEMERQVEQLQQQIKVLEIFKESAQQREDARKSEGFIPLCFFS